MQIYIVMGTSGEYSDRSEWPVVAYQDEGLAQQHVLLASGEARRVHLELREIDWHDHDKWEENQEAHSKLLASNPYDPQMQDDYTGVTYYYHTVDLAVELPQTSEIKV